MANLYWQWTADLPYKFQNKKFCCGILAMALLGYHQGNADQQTLHEQFSELIFLR